MCSGNLGLGTAGTEINGLVNGCCHVGPPVSSFQQLEHPIDARVARGHRCVGPGNQPWHADG